MHCLWHQSRTKPLQLQGQTPLPHSNLMAVPEELAKEVKPLLNCPILFPSHPRPRCFPYSLVHNKATDRKQVSLGWCCGHVNGSIRTVWERDQHSSATGRRYTQQTVAG